MGEGYTTAINFHIKIQSFEDIPVLTFKPVHITCLELRVPSSAEIFARVSVAIL